VVFADTSFWIGLSIPRDSRHRESEELLKRCEGTQIVTSGLVLGETWTFLSRRLGHAAAVAFLDRLTRTPRLVAVSVSEEREGEAWEWLRRHDERPYSFVDATSFALMRSMGIREALAFDADFTAAGFVELRP
jgi:predicted nucleic acid-binding protein